MKRIVKDSKEIPKTKTKKCLLDLGLEVVLDTDTEKHC